ncbi:MAG: nucleoprotein/polynucleotide-associated enzyme [Cycloclasticus sp.]|nr:nucleoprotein/polynucleotide-associated enzyme [Cycloclasticus sp.]MBG96339.1 nucleoprotein/polynucleotide-associated enzyme [Cycloclasticus sp.]HAI96298.1 DUF2058 domain-containing protein [Methylococcaceae bacterium]|tara:strand:- start:924 stop:1463 length:540 start_codon:yes stop_codon:yes gene_type:complete
MKNNSLQDQLLKAGLTSKSKAHKVKKQKNKQVKQKHKNKLDVANEAALLAEQSRIKQQEKNRLLNAQQNQQAEKKQLAGQVNQLIAQNKIPKGDDGQAFNFIHHHKVKSLYVDDTLRQRLVAGSAVIVDAGKAYEVVPADVAEKIAMRDKDRVVLINAVATRQEDEYYADYEVPDDLMW